MIFLPAKLIATACVVPCAQEYGIATWINLAGCCSRGPLQAREILASAYLIHRRGIACCVAVEPFKIRNGIVVQCLRATVITFPGAWPIEGGVKHFGFNCGDYCPGGIDASKSGQCPSWCGEKGVCCKFGQKRINCSGDVGVKDGGWTCVPAAPLRAPFLCIAFCVKIIYIMRVHWTTLQHFFVAHYFFTDTFFL